MYNYIYNNNDTNDDNNNNNSHNHKHTNCNKHNNYIIGITPNLPTPARPSCFQATSIDSINIITTRSNWIIL